MSTSATLASPQESADGAGWTGPLGTTARGLVGQRLYDVESLGLADAPLLVWRRRAREGALELFAAFARPLTRRSLMDLLFDLAPYKARGPDDINGVLDDWLLFERARDGGASEALLLQHAQGLRADWQEFARHQQLFVGVLQDPSEATALLPVLRWQAHDGRRDWRFDLEGSPGIEFSATPDALAGFLTLAYFFRRLRRGWPQWRPLARDGKSNMMGPAQVPVLALLHKRGIANNRLLQAIESLAGLPTRPEGSARNQRK